MAGTGLPQLKSKDVLAQAPGLVSGDRYSSAAAWGSLARSAEQVANTAGNLYGQEVQQQQAGYLADLELDAQKTRNDMREKHQFDPKGFETEWQAYYEGKMSQVPTFAVTHAKKYIGSLGEQTRGAILNETSNRNTALAGKSVLESIKSSEDDLVGLAMAGKIGSPDWIAANEKYNSQLSTAVSTKLMNTESADLRTEDVIGKARGEEAARSSLSVYEEKGYEEATKHARQSILENDKLSLTPSQRTQTYNRAISAINQAKKEDAADRIGMVDMSRKMREDIKGGSSYDMGSVQQLHKSLTRVGAYHEANMLVREVSIRETTSPITNGTLTIPEQAAYLKGLRGGGSTENLVNAVKRFEGFTPSAAWDYKQFSLGYGTRGKAGETIDERAADVRLRQELSRAADIVDRVNPTLPPGARAAMISLTFNAGSDWVNADLGASIRAGDLEGAKARFVQYNKAGGATNPGLVARRNQEVQWFETGVPSGGSPAKVNPTQAALPSVSAGVSQASAAYVTNAKKVWPEMQTAVVDKGRSPTLEDYEAMVYAASLSKDPEWMGQVEAVGVVAGFNDANATLAQRQAYVDSVKAKFQDNGWSIDETSFTNYLEKAQKERSDRLKDDPISMAVERTGDAPIPLNLGDAKALQQGLQERSALVQRIAAENDIPVGPALRDFEVRQVKNALETSSLDTKIGIYQTMARTLPEAVYRATMEKLGTSGDTLDRFVGIVARDRPELAREILRGAELMKLDKTGAKSEDVRGVFQDKIGGDLYPSPADQNNVTQAAMAVYTSRRGGSGALYDKTDAAGIEKALEDVAGKIVKRNGMKVAAPPKMSDATFTTIVSSMTADQLAKFGGTSLDPKFLNDKAVLKQMEPGGSMYMVAVPNRLARDGISPVMTNDGRPLVIDVNEMPQPRWTPEVTGPLTPTQASRAAARSAASFLEAQ